MMNIRQITPNDDLADIAAQCNHSDWDDQEDAELITYSEKTLRSYLENPHHVMIAAFDNDKIAGIAIGYILPHPSGNKTLYIDELDVRSNYRRQGVATELMEFYRAYCKQNQLDEVWLSANIENQAAQKLYRSLSPTEDKQAVVFGWSQK